MSGKQQGSPAPRIRPRGPTISGPPLAARYGGTDTAARDSFAKLASTLGGAVSSMVGSYFLGPIGGVAGMLAGQRIGQEQANVIYGRPFLERTGDYTSEQNLIPLVASAIGGAGGGYLGGAAGGLAGSTGSSVGGYLGGQAGSYFGGQLGNSLVARARPRSTNGYVFGGY